MVFAINNYNVPTNNQGGTMVMLAVSQHPTGHANALQTEGEDGVPGLGYDRALVLSSIYKFDIHYVGANDAKKDFIFAYKFAGGSANGIAFTAGAAVLPALWADIRMTKGWAYTEFSAINSGGSMHPSQGTVIVRIPNVPKMAHKLNNIQTTAMDWRDFTVSVADSTAGAAVNTFLHCIVFTKGGEALALLDILIDVTCYQRVRLFKNIDATAMIDEVDQVG